MHFIKHPKKRGEWVEIQFLARATEHGLTVSKPWGDSSPYDFAVEHDGRFSRVQVKSTTRGVKHAYVCDLRSAAKRLGYRTDEIDYFAAYVVPHDVWYILPIAAVTRSIWLSPQLPAHRHLQYKEAWHLLKGADPLSSRP